MSRTRIKIVRGKYYSIFTTGGSHPALVFKKNKKRNMYYVIVFDSSPGRHRTKLAHPTSDNVKNSYVQNRPLVVTKREFGNHEFLGLMVHKQDKPIIEIVKRREPRLSRKFKEYHNI